MMPKAQRSVAQAEDAAFHPEPEPDVCIGNMRGVQGALVAGRNQPANEYRSLIHRGFKKAQMQPQLVLIRCALSLDRRHLKHPEPALDGSRSKVKLTAQLRRDSTAEPAISEPETNGLNSAKLVGMCVLPT